MPSVRYEARDCDFDPAEGDFVSFSAAWDPATLTFRALGVVKLEPIQGLIHYSPDKVRGRGRVKADRGSHPALQRHLIVKAGRNRDVYLYLSTSFHLNSF